MYLKLKRLFIIPILCISILFCSVTTSYYSPVIVAKASGSSVALNWFITVLATLGQSYSSSVEASRSLYDFQKFITGKLAEPETTENGKVTIDTTSGVMTFDVAQVEVFNELVGRGDLNSAITHGTNTGVLKDSFTELVRFVKAYFDSLIDWGKTVIDSVGTQIKVILAPIIDASKTSVTQYINSESFLNLCEYQKSISPSFDYSQIVSNYNNLSSVDKLKISDSMGSKYLICVGSAPLYNNSVVTFLDIDDTSTSLYCLNVNNRYNMKIVNPIKTEYLTAGYGLYVLSDSGLIDYTNNISRRTLTFSGGKIPLELGIGGAFNSCDFVGVDYENFFYKSEEDYNNLIPTVLTVNDYTDGSVIDQDYTLTKIGDTVIDTTDEDVKPIPIDIIRPLDADLTIPNVIDGEYTDIQSEVISITDSIPDVDIKTDAVTSESDISSYSLPLVGLFPFCIPFDVYAFVKSFDAPAVAPVAILSVMIPVVNVPFSYTIDLNILNDLAKIIRGLEALSFLFGLMFITYKMIKW